MFSKREGLPFVLCAVIFLGGCATAPELSNHVTDLPAIDSAEVARATTIPVPPLAAPGAGGPIVEPQGNAPPLFKPPQEAPPPSAAPQAKPDESVVPFLPVPTRPGSGPHIDVSTFVFRTGPPLVNTWVSVATVAKSVGATAPVTQAAILPTVSISSQNGKFTVIAEKSQAVWNGLNVSLGFLPKMVAGKLSVSALDARKTVEPLLALPHGPNADAKVLVLDPGHGGAETGTLSIVDGSFEKEYTLDWAKRAKPLLEAEGWTVYLTRTEDRKMSLEERVAFADKVRADLFVSLHFNAGSAPGGPASKAFAVASGASATPAHSGANGLETYCLTPAGMPSTLLRDAENIGDVFPNNAFDAQNLQYAVLLHQAVLAMTGEKDRGVRHARFMGVLKTQTRPSVLIEGGYLSDPEEAKQIETANYRQRLAEGVARALAHNNLNTASLGSAVGGGSP